MLLVVMGAITFSGGLALYLSLSPLLVNLIAGVVVANLARGRARAGIRNVLMRGEHSIYILFLILVGACWKKSREANSRLCGPEFSHGVGRSSPSRRRSGAYTTLVVGLLLLSGHVAGHVLSRLACHGSPDTSAWACSRDRIFWASSREKPSANSVF